MFRAVGRGNWPLLWRSLPRCSIRARTRASNCFVCTGADSGTARRSTCRWRLGEQGAGHPTRRSSHRGLLWQPGRCLGVCGLYRLRKPHQLNLHLPGEHTPCVRVLVCACACVCVCVCACVRACVCAQGFLLVHLGAAGASVNGPGLSPVPCPGVYQPVD